MLSHELSGTTALVTAGSGDDRDAYLLTAAGLSPLP